MIEGADVWAFRLTVVGGLVGLYLSVRKIVTAIRDAAANEAAFKARVQDHLEEADKLIPEHRAHALQIAHSLAEVKAQGERLDRFIKTQDEANQDFRGSIKWLMRNSGGGSRRLSSE